MLPQEQQQAQDTGSLVAFLSDVVGQYRNNRNAFFTNIMGVARLEHWQARENDALDAGCARLSVRSGHGVGKTMFLSGQILHFAFTRFPFKIAVTAPSAPQLHDALEAEARFWLKRLETRQPLFSGILKAQSGRLFMEAAPESGFCSYRTSRKEAPEALQGIHADNVLLIADEASGVDEAVFEAAAGSMSTKGAITILAGNPTRSTGFFHRTHTLFSGVWRSVRVSCHESTRVDPAYIEEERLFGTDSNRFRVRVLGEFPKGDEDTLIARELVESAQKRNIIPPRSEPIYWGVDVARSLYRDKSSLAKRKGPVILEKVKRWQYNDTMRLVGQLKKEYDTAPEKEKPEAIFVDVIGVGGGVLDRLIELDLPAVGINVGELPGVLGRGVRLRDELWLNVRDWFATKVVHFPSDDPDTVEELVAPIVQQRSDGKEKVESKQELRQRGILGGKSPDGADAVCLTFARSGAITAGAMQGTSRRGPLRRNTHGRV